jgi:hypothetical protein
LTLEALRDVQADVVERELRALTPDTETFLTLRYESYLVDLGARAALSERAADAIDEIARRLDCTRSSRRPERRLNG